MHVEWRENLETWWREEPDDYVRADICVRKR